MLPYLPCSPIPYNFTIFKSLFLWRLVSLRAVYCAYFHSAYSPTALKELGRRGKETLKRKWKKAIFKKNSTEHHIGALEEHFILASFLEKINCASRKRWISTLGTFSHSSKWANSCPTLVNNRVNWKKLLDRFYPNKKKLNRPKFFFMLLSL
jgi:hypothetical protein